MPQRRQFADQALDSTEVAWVVGKRAAAVRAEDAEYLASRYAPGVVSFGFAPPLSPYADESHRVEWLREWFDRFDRRIGYQVEELTVSIAGDVAFCHSRDRFSARPVGRWQRRTQVRLDTTLGLARIGGVWLVTVERVRVVE